MNFKNESHFCLSIRSASLVTENSSIDSSTISDPINSLSPSDEKTSETVNLTKKSNILPRINQIVRICSSRTINYHHYLLLQNGRLDPLSSTSNPGLIRLFCIRHGERVDFAFGPTWPESAFDKSGKISINHLHR